MLGRLAAARRTLNDAGAGVRLDRLAEELSGKGLTRSRVRGDI